MQGARFEPRAMLSPLILIAGMARKQRLKLKMTQRAVARKVGCSQPYVAQVERGRRPISRALAEKLEVLFGVRKGTYTMARFFRGRPALTPQSRHVLKMVRTSRGAPARVLPEGLPPKCPRSDRVAGLADPFDPIDAHLGEQAGKEVRQLEALRPYDERFWRAMNSVHYDSWSEKRLMTRVGLTGVQLTGTSPARLGCALQFVDGKTGRDTSRKAHPFFLIQHRDTAVTWSTQRCVRTPSGVRWPDITLVVARAGRKVTAVVEVQGAEFHSDEAAELRRTRDLGVSVLAVDAGEIGSPGLVDRILDWACSLVA
jgi:transcriptional regulator with XRE-family HTH domain